MVDVGGKDTVRRSIGGRKDLYDARVSGTGQYRPDKKGDNWALPELPESWRLNRPRTSFSSCHLMNLTYAEIGFPSMTNCNQSGHRTDHRQNRCGDGSADRRIRRSPDNLRYVQGCGQDNDNRNVASPQIRRKSGVFERFHGRIIDYLRVVTDRCTNQIAVRNCLSRKALLMSDRGRNSRHPAYKIPAENRWGGLLLHRES